MKSNQKKIILTTILIFTILLYGCDKIRVNTYKEAGEPGVESAQKKAKNSDSESIEDDSEDISDITMATQEEDDNKDEPTPTGIQPVDNVELLVYTINGAANLEAVTALIPEGKEITPQLIVDTVKSSMADNSLSIGIESVTTEDDAVIVSFYSDQPPLMNVGAGMEAAILDAIAQSLIDNLDDYNKVIYRVEGNAYSSGHIELDINEVYLGN
ncbi:hypothetical protein I5677_15860 [Mobilitalea sibirica]|uniref:GerMN domain-containing protein n=1 Tax=Mobilitalea sibirica TaxID=1462919 RepID=A0A8J7L0H3_9FIRM|nr:hypothetical protein [Mobilitalea sibirica]MBH1942378.1 hypothetical protein [Mobilitalea sibirica]